MGCCGDWGDRGELEIMRDKNVETTSNQHPEGDFWYHFGNPHGFWWRQCKSGLFLIWKVYCVLQFARLAVWSFGGSVNLGTAKNTKTNCFLQRIPWFLEGPQVECRKSQFLQGHLRCCLMIFLNTIHFVTQIPGISHACLLLKIPI